MSRIFAPALDSVVATDFIHAGVQCKRGEPFPHRELKLTEHALRGLWLAHLIDFVVPEARPAAPAPTVPGKQAQQSQPQRR